MIQYKPKTYILPEQNRPKLQEIWGTPIFFGNEAEVNQQYQKFIKGKAYKLIITVGDYCSHHLRSDIKIFDNMVQRKIFDKVHPHTLILENPAGTIREDSWNIIKSAITKKENICVKGEEDLLVIPAILQAPAHALVTYGYPNKGICLLEVNQKLKKEFCAFLKENFA